MIIYVISQWGCSPEEYHICAVAETREKAESIVKIIDPSLWGEPHIEEHDTELFADVLTKEYKPYECKMSYSDILPAVAETVFDGWDSFDVEHCPLLEYHTGKVIAKNAEHASKIFLEKVSAYNAKNGKSNKS